MKKKKGSLGLQFDKTTESVVVMQKHMACLFSLSDRPGEGLRKSLGVQTSTPPSPAPPPAPRRWLRTPSLNPFIAPALVGVTGEACQLDVGHVVSALGNWARLPEFIPEL